MTGESRNRGHSDFSNVVNDIVRRLPSALDKEKDPKGDDFIYCAEKTGQLLAQRGVSVSQIRKVFNKTRKIKFDNEGIYELKILRAMIAYTAGRFGKKMNEFKDIFSKAVEVAEGSEEKLKRFKKFFEAVVAYHRAYGGDDK
ncbi:MAG: type III-A CRISPR-associated protein Csm2 [Thermosediminibacteraceae bacterium]|nr:type III-A CRISPR-associated protein Csm2 [Thermosediminibacteraceae bacterium]